MAAGAVTRNEAAGAYELVVDGHRAFAAYRLEDGVATFFHTVVPDALAGRGIGLTLIAGALADVRTRGWRVRPTCPFVRRYFDKHPELADLLA